MKSFISRLMFIVCLTILCQGLYAQAPTITKNIGIPSGANSGRGIAYGNGKYVSIFYTNRVYTSTDGENWLKVNDAGIPGGTEFKSISFGAGIFVIAGNNGLILTSTNGTNWTSRTSGTANHFTDVQYLENEFFAVGMNTTLRRSTDGITWNTITIGAGTATDMFMNITFGNGAFTIGARNSGSNGIYIYRSTTANSNSWTFQDVAFGSINKVQYLKDRFFIFCSNTNVYTSADASSWTDNTASMIVTLPNSSTQTIGTPNQVFNGIYDGTKIYLAGYSNYHNSYGGLYSSTDGINFTLEPKTAYIVNQGTAYLNNKYFQYGNEGLVLSTDGTNYKFSAGSYNAIASNGTTYAGVGAIGSGGVIFSSADFNTWINRTPSTQKPLYGVVYTGAKFVAAGEETVMESTDNGITWTEIATPNEWMGGLAYGSSRLVACGYDADTYEAHIIYSADGINWITANTDNNYYLRAKNENGNFFVFGYSNDTYLGVVMHSTDGISWTDITPTLPYSVAYFNDVVYDGAKYHLMGMEFADPGNWIVDDFFTVSTSTLANVNSWGNKGTITSQPPGAQLGGTWGEGAIAYSNGRFAGAVNDVNTGETHVIYSSDGISWIAEPQGESSIIFAALPEGNTFRLLGTGDGKISVSFSSFTLPVHLSSFHVSLVNGQSILKWQTASEQNSHRFIVQYSTDANNWNNIGTVMAAGESESLRDYEFIHIDPQAGYNYYRIIQTDIDGRQQISSIKNIVIGEKVNIRLSPNPAREWVRVELPRQQSSTISLFNAGGQQVYRQTHTGNIIRLSLLEMPHGIYQVVVEQEGKRYTQQLYKQ